MEYIFSSYDKFIDEYRNYHSHECSKCGSFREQSNEQIDIIIEDRKMHFKDLLMLTCTKCGLSCLPYHSKQMIDGCYKIMIKEGHYEGIQSYKGYRKQFGYCTNQNFLYDHRDYYNIPGLCFDEEHSVEGFLTPVYFTKKVLLYFMQDPEYNVRLGSETYGYLSFKDEWGIPFGINRNGKVVFWLGDLNYTNEMTLSIMKPHNVDSDHQLIVSEFYAAQMCCIWSEPNREMRICSQKNTLFEAISVTYNVSLYHLEDEIKQQKEKYLKPVLITEKTIEPMINMLHKVLIEGVNISEFKKLYQQLFNPQDKKYTEWKSIRFFEALLGRIIVNGEDIKEIIAPLYLLNDFRQYYDHLLSNEKKNSIRDNILHSLDVESFENMEEIYDKLLNRLNVLFEYLIVGYSS